MAPLAKTHNRGCVAVQRKCYDGYFIDDHVGTSHKGPVYNDNLGLYENDYSQAGVRRLISTPVQVPRKLDVNGATTAERAEEAASNNSSEILKRRSWYGKVQDDLGEPAQCLHRQRAVSEGYILNQTGDSNRQINDTNSPIQTKASRLYRTALIVGFGMARATGQKNRLLRKVAFFPPSPPGYTMEEVFPAKKALTGGHGSRLSPLRLCGRQADIASFMRVKETIVQLSSKSCTIPRPAQSLLPRHGIHDIQIYSGCISPGNLARVNLAFMLLWHEETSGRGAATESLAAKHLQQFKPADRDLCSRPFIIFSHGNSTDLGHTFQSVMNLAHELQCNVLAYDYAGYGCSEGRITDKTGTRDLGVIHRFVVDVLNVPADLIILYGQSIGSIPTCSLACRPNRYPIGAVILHSPIASALRLVLHDPSRVPLVDVFHNADRIGACPWPIQLVHGSKDRDVPIWHCQLLYDLAVDPTRPHRQAREVFVRKVVSRLQMTRHSSDDRLLHFSNHHEPFRRRRATTPSVQSQSPFNASSTETPEAFKADAVMDGKLLPAGAECPETDEATTANTKEPSRRMSMRLTNSICQPFRRKNGTSHLPALSPLWLVKNDANTLPNAGKPIGATLHATRELSEKQMIHLIGRFWSRRVRLCTIQGAGHNDIETRYKQQLFHTLNSFVDLAVPSSTIRSCCQNHS